MKKRSPGTHILAVLIALAPLAWLALTWNSIPGEVTLHYNLQLKPDRTGNKSALWAIAGIVSATSVAVYFLLNNLSAIDPKRKNLPPSRSFSRLATGLVIFLAILNLLILISAKEGSIVLSRFLFPLIGLLFAFIGNYMHTIRPNYFAGLRLPWTLSDHENWKKTHAFAGKWWFWGGLAFAAASIFLPGNSVIYVLLGMALLLVLIPAVYSYRLYKKKQYGNTGNLH